jgi:hypothetical protein
VFEYSIPFRLQRKAPIQRRPRFSIRRHPRLRLFALRPNSKRRYPPRANMANGYVSLDYLAWFLISFILHRNDLNAALCPSLWSSGIERSLSRSLDHFIPGSNSWPVLPCIIQVEHCYRSHIRGPRQSVCLGLQSKGRESNVSLVATPIHFHTGFPSSHLGEISWYFRSPKISTVHGRYTGNR